ncbi:MAG: hypothetical protein RR595_08820 [Lysinibacillus sp.]
MAIKWRNKIEQWITVVGFIAGVIGLVCFIVFAYQQIGARADETIELFKRFF